MTIHHHLSDVTLGAHVAGSLSESMSLVAASHISICPICFERQNRMEELGGIHLQNSDPKIMSENALRNVMAVLDQHELEQDGNSDVCAAPISIANEGFSSKDEFPIIPRPLQNFMPDNFEDVKWTPLAPGIKYCAIPDFKTEGGTLCLLNVSPGKKIPEHGHQGVELTQVLKGSFSDAVGCFSAGDIVDIDDEIKHQPVVSSLQSCICLIASEAPLKFTGFIPKVAHYFSGM